MNKPATRWKKLPRREAIEGNINELATAAKHALAGECGELMTTGDRARTACTTALSCTTNPKFAIE